MNRKKSAFKGKQNRFRSTHTSSTTNNRTIDNISLRDSRLKRERSTDEIARWCGVYTQHICGHVFNLHVKSFLLSSQFSSRMGNSHETISSLLTKPDTYPRSGTLFRLRQFRTCTRLTELKYNTLANNRICFD